MSQTVPPTITAAPTPYPVRNDRTTFSARVDAFVTWLVAAVAQFAAVATNVYNNAVDGYSSAVAANASAVAAAASAALAGAIAWVSGTTYAINDARISTLNYLVYRRITNGAGTLDPSIDPTNWVIANLPPIAQIQVQRAIRNARLSRFS